MEGESSKTYFFGNGDNSIPAWAAFMNNNNGLFGGNGGWGGGILGFLLGLFFGNGWGGFGGFGNGFGGNAGAGFLSNQIDNNAGRELLMNAINSNGEASRSAIQNLATMLGQDYNQVSTAAEQFLDTWDHEKGHLAMHICITDNIDPYSEEYQYLTGEIGRQMFKAAQPFLCDECRKHLLEEE